MARSEDERYLTLEDQLAQLRQQVVEERESRGVAEKAAADRAAKQEQEHDDVMQALARLSMPRESRDREIRRKRRQSRVARSGILRHHPKFCPALPKEKVLYPSRSVPGRIDLARADKTETTVSLVSPLDT